MKMKNIAAVAMAGCMAASLAACGGSCKLRCQQRGIH